MKKSQLTKMVCSALILGNVFCVPAFASEDVDNNTAYNGGHVYVSNVASDLNNLYGAGATVTNGSGNHASNYANVTVLNSGYENIVHGIGATVEGVKGDHRNTAVSNGAVYVSNHGNGANLLGIGSAVNGGSHNTAISNGVTVASIGNGSRDSGTLNYNVVQGIGAEASGGSNNKAYADYVSVKSECLENGQNVVVARGAFVSSEGAHNTAISKGVTALNLGHESKVYAAGATVQGVKGDTGVSGNWAISNGSVYASNNGNGGDVKAIGSAVNGGSSNIAFSNGVTVNSYGNGSRESGTLKYNQVYGIGAEVVGGTNNRAYANYVSVDSKSPVGFLPNTIVARGALVSAGSYNTAISNGVTLINNGGNNTITAIGAMVTRYEPKTK